MPKKILISLLYVWILSICIPRYGLCEDMAKDDILKQMTAFKELGRQLEARSEKSHAKEKLTEAVVKEARTEKEEHHHGVRSLADRVRRIEELFEATRDQGKWAEKVSLSGLVEVEARYEKFDSTDTDSSDIVLATGELGVDVDIQRHVGGHVLFLWEEGDTEPVDIDEGFIILEGEDVVPLHLNAGKMYIPFGYFKSHFISDPVTLEIGETNESAVKAGFAKDWVELCVAVFNGDIDEQGDENHIDGFVGTARFTLPEDSVPNVGLTAGVSYLSNIADSDGLQGETPGAIKEHVGGFGAFLSVSFMDRFFFEAEYIGASDEFEAGELSFDAGKRLKPKARNFELAYALSEDLEMAFKYEGGDDLGDFQPDKQLGGVISYDLFERTTLALEYLNGEFENDDQRDLITSQLAIEF